MNIHKDKYLKYKEKYLNLKYGSGNSKLSGDTKTSVPKKKPVVKSILNPKAHTFIPKPLYEKDINKLSTKLITKSLSDHNIIFHELDNFILVSLNIAQRQIIDIVNYNGNWRAYTKIHNEQLDNYVNSINFVINDININYNINKNLKFFINALYKNYNILAIIFYNKITRETEVVINFNNILSKLHDDNLTLSRIILYMESNEEYKNRINIILSKLFIILDTIEKPIFICLQEISPLDLFIESFNALKKTNYSILTPELTEMSKPQLFENLKTSYQSHSILIHSNEIKIKTDDFLKNDIMNLNARYLRAGFFKNPNRISEYQFTINNKTYYLINIHLYLITNNNDFFLALNELINKKEETNIIIVGDSNIQNINIEEYKKLLEPNFINFYSTSKGNTYDMLIKKKSRKENIKKK